MANPEVIVHQNGVQAGRSWSDAYFAFLKDPKQGLAIKIMPLALIGIVPLSILDDILLPFVGTVDDIPTAVLVAIVATLTWTRVRKYR